MWTHAEYQTNLSTDRVIHTKIEVLNMDNKIVDYIEGIVESGTISIGSSNMIRRTLDVTFVCKDDKLEISSTSPIWINKRLKVYIGIEDYSKKVYYFNQGIYVLSDPTTDVSISGRHITIKGNDKMQLFNRPLLTDIKFNVDTPVSEAIKGLCDMVGETNILIEKTDYKIPYDMQFSIGSDICSALKDVANLYMDYQVYYNVDGYLVFEKIKNRINDATIWDFESYMNTTTTRSKVTGYDDIRNYVKVVGKINEDTGELPLYEIKIEGYDEPLSIENIGLRPEIITEDKYYNIQQCKSRCEYEIEKTQKLVNRFSINCVPIYLISDVNKLINIIDKGVKYKCLIDSISIPLGIGEMSISAHEIF